MTSRQKALKAVYPLFTAFNRLFGKNTRVLKNPNNIQPVQSIYTLGAVLNGGTRLSMKELKGKKLLLVNTASDCGYTGQYEELQKLYQQYEKKLMVIGFPANDFHEQEKRSDKEIQQFCTINYGVHFPLASKSVVIKSAQQNEVFKWLSDKAKNGWNDQAPTWNFSKYLINENGTLIAYFDPAVSPLSTEVVSLLGN